VEGVPAKTRPVRTDFGVEGCTPYRSKATGSSASDVEEPRRSLQNLRNSTERIKGFLEEFQGRVIG